MVFNVQVNVASIQYAYLHRDKKKETRRNIGTIFCVPFRDYYVPFCSLFITLLEIKNQLISGLSGEYNRVYTLHP